MRSAALALCLSLPCYPWASSKSKSHADIAERAAACVPGPEFAAFAKKNLARLRAGAVEPDLHRTCKPESKVTCRKDLGIAKHFFNLLDDQRGQDIEKVAEEFKTIEAMIARGRSKSAVAFELGILAHFVSDISQPLHCGGVKTDKREDDYHNKFEHLRDKHPLDTGACSSRQIDGPIDEWQLQNAKDASQHYKALSADFADNKKLDGDAVQIFERQWRKAVNDVADAFRTLFERHEEYFRAD